MKKICTVVGARPQFIKLAVVSKEIRKHFKEVIIHTGQHYDPNMSDIFFEEMDIPKPDYNLGISGGTHGKMTGEMLIEIEKVLLTEKPDGMLLYGDTNSTLAATLAAVKLHIPIFHVESGNRFGTLESPEEVNRIVTDHTSSLCFACTDSAYNFLCKEGLEKRALVAGDPMYDAFLHYSSIVTEEDIQSIKDFDGNTVSIPKSFYYMTCHRQENTDTDEALTEIFSAMNSLDAPTIYPVHPRNKARALKLCTENNYSNIVLTQPVGYKTSIYLVNNAKKIVTDSGGVQREAFFAKKPCVTVLDFVVWPETMNDKCNQLAKPIKDDILQKLTENIEFDDNYKPFGNGKSGIIIVENIIKFYRGI